MIFFKFFSIFLVILLILILYSYYYIHYQIKSGHWLNLKNFYCLIYCCLFLNYLKSSCCFLKKRNKHYFNKLFNNTHIHHLCFQYHQIFRYLLAISFRFLGFQIHSFNFNFKHHQFYRLYFSQQPIRFRSFDFNYLFEKKFIVHEKTRILSFITINNRIGIINHS